jgi:hypothetical protein
MDSDSLQMHRIQPHPQGTSALPPTAGPGQPVAETPDRGIVFKTRYPSACKECRRRKQKVSFMLLGDGMVVFVFLHASRPLSDRRLLP